MDSPVPGAGRSSDFRLTAHESGFAVRVEFKAIGLSNEELVFFRRAASLLPQLCPERGISTNHVSFDNTHLPRVPSRKERRLLAREDRKRQSKLPPHIRDLHGAVVTAHQTEQRYLERVRDCIVTALSQLSDRDEGWVALWWSNGAPPISIRQVLTTIDLPPHVLGVILTGAGVGCAVTSDPLLRHRSASRGASAFRRQAPVVSLEDNPLAEPIYDAFIGSTGVRPTLLLEPTGTRGRERPFWPEMAAVAFSRSTS